jgi:large repetitive protein
VRGRRPRLRATHVLALVLACASACGPTGTALPAPRADRAASAPLALDPAGTRLWVVNPDADTVTVLDTRTLDVIATHATGAEPWSVAALHDGAVVANRAAGTLTVLRDGRSAEVQVGPEPGGVVLAPDGRHAYVTVSSDDAVAIVDLTTLTVTDRIAVGRWPWAIAVTATPGQVAPTLLVSHRRSRLRAVAREGEDEGQEAWLTVIRGDGAISEIVLAPSSDAFSNALEGLAIVGDHVWVAHLLNRPGPPFTFHTTLSGGIATVSLDAAVELLETRIDTNESTFSTPVNFPRAIAVTRDQGRAYVVLAGTNVVMGIDLTNPTAPTLVGFWPVGDNPRGIALSADETRAYVMNYLSRDVSVLDLTDTIRRREIARVTTTPETLDPQVLAGKILFNLAADPRLSRLGWVSCASCHLDGGVDGTSWSTPEGLRQTMPLWNLAGTAPFHASATRDEIQDFDHDIRALMGGVGLAASPPSMLGPSAAGRSEALDALAAFVLHGIRVPNAPTAGVEAIAAGREVFAESGCAACHGGPAWTRSHLPGEPGTLGLAGQMEVEASLIDVGTFARDTDVLGAIGFDVPTLLGLHATAPYLHDGSARTLSEVLGNGMHVGRPLDERDVDVLAAFLLSIDASTEPFE